MSGPSVHALIAIYLTANQINKIRWHWNILPIFILFKKIYFSFKKNRNLFLFLKIKSSIQSKDLLRKRKNLPCIVKSFFKIFLKKNHRK